ncbi:MAG: alpha/beta fold hydrolase [Candidatus Binatia bacterium]
MHINELSLRVIDEGKGTPVVLLHGFPDSSYLWRHQIPALVGAGFRVIAPDLRGFGQSDKPEAVHEYALPVVINDVTGVMDQLGIQRAHVVGHDWGAAVGWMLGAYFPERVDRLVALSVGHLATFMDLPIEQREKSWYMLLFQFQGVAEQLLQADDWKLFRQFLRNQGDVDRYLEDLSRPGALTAALNWYRANVAPEMLVVPAPPVPPVQAPTLGIWSSGDKYLLEEGMTRSAEHVLGPWRYERIEGAGHWIPVDAPEQLNRLLLEFLTR